MFPINPYQSPEPKSDSSVIIADIVLTKKEKEEIVNRRAATIIMLLSLGITYAMYFETINEKIKGKINETITRMKDTFDTPLK